MHTERRTLRRNLVAQPQVVELTRVRTRNYLYQLGVRPAKPNEEPHIRIDGIDYIIVGNRENRPT